MRRCEKCKGPGPCLYANEGPDTGRYLCKACHPKPQDPFFQDRRKAWTLEQLEALDQIVARGGLHPDCHLGTIADLMKELRAALVVVNAAELVNRHATVTPLVYGSKIEAQSTDLWALREVVSNYFFNRATGQ